MTTPSRSNIVDIMKEYIDRIRNQAMKTYTCSSCTLEVKSCNILDAPMDAIPNHGLLQLTTRHPDHDLFHGMLLEPKGVDIEKKRANICHECYGSLERNLLPPLSLANNMWIGRVPNCLQILTLAERLLIAIYLPTAYIIKLYPKQAGAAHWDPTQLYSGFKA